MKKMTLANHWLDWGLDFVALAGETNEDNGHRQPLVGLVISYSLFFWIMKGISMIFNDVFMYSFLTIKILRDQIWVSGYFGQPLTHPDFTIFSSGFFCNSLKS
jgi:hypothetical protein